MLSRVRRPLSEIPVAQCDHPKMTTTPEKFDDQTPHWCGDSAAVALECAAIPPLVQLRMRSYFAARSIVSWNTNPNT